MGEIIIKSLYNQNSSQNIKPIKMTVKDIDQIKEIYKSYWGEKGLYKDVILKKIINQRLSYVYKIKNEIIAFCLMYYNYKKCIVCVALLCVKKEYKGKHLGNSLLTFCINHCKNNYYRKFELHVSSTNYPAIKLYTKLGFEVKSFIQSYYHDENPKDNNAYYMTLNI